jgi:hypothetical protein
MIPAPRFLPTRQPTCESSHGICAPRGDSCSSYAYPMLHTENFKIDDINAYKMFFKVKKVIAAKSNVEIEI